MNVNFVFFSLFIHFISRAHCSARWQLCRNRVGNNFSFSSTRSCYSPNEFCEFWHQFKCVYIWDLFGSFGREPRRAMSPNLTVTKLQIFFLFANGRLRPSPRFNIHRRELNKIDDYSVRACELYASFGALNVSPAAQPSEQFGIYISMRWQRVFSFHRIKDGNGNYIENDKNWHIYWRAWAHTCI